MDLIVKVLVFILIIAIVYLLLKFLGLKNSTKGGTDAKYKEYIKGLEESVEYLKSLKKELIFIKYSIVNVRDFIDNKVGLYFSYPNLVGRTVFYENYILDIVNYFDTSFTDVKNIDILFIVNTIEYEKNVTDSEKNKIMDNFNKYISGLEKPIFVFQIKSENEKYETNFANIKIEKENNILNNGDSFNTPLKLDITKSDEFLTPESLKEVKLQLDKHKGFKTVNLNDKRMKTYSENVKRFRDDLNYLYNDSDKILGNRKKDFDKLINTIYDMYTDKSYLKKYLYNMYGLQIDAYKYNLKSKIFIAANNVNEIIDLQKNTPDFKCKIDYLDDNIPEFEERYEKADNSTRANLENIYEDIIDYKEANDIINKYKSYTIHGSHTKYVVENMLDNEFDIKKIYSEDNFKNLVESIYENMKDKK